jgi:hypothetical protein
MEKNFKNNYLYTIRELAELFESSQNKISTFRDLPSDIMITRPDNGSWSITEICDHLVVFGKLYLKEIDKAITIANPVPQREGPFKPRWHIRRLASMFEPPYRMKMKTLPVFQPSKSENLSETLDGLSDIQANVHHILDQAGASRWNLKKIKGKNPAFRFLSMSLIEYFVMMDVHQRRHFWQIEQTLNRIRDNENLKTQGLHSKDK